MSDAPCSAAARTKSAAGRPKKVADADAPFGPQGVVAVGTQSKGKGKAAALPPPDVEAAELSPAALAAALHEEDAHMATD